MGLVKRGNVWWMNLIFQGQRIRRSTGTANRALADSIMAKVKVQLIEGQYFDRLEEKTRTFDELMDRFEREHLVKLASQQICQVFVKRFRAFFGGRTLAEITPRLIVDYKSTRYAAGVQAASINRELSCLRKAFNLAKREWEWCRENPVSRVSLEKGANKRDRWLTEDEEARLLSACPSWLRDLVVFALHTGMRLGEILSLTWSAVDLVRRTAHGAVESYRDGAPHREGQGAPPENMSRVSKSGWHTSRSQPSATGLTACHGQGWDRGLSFP